MWPSMDGDPGASCHAPRILLREVRSGLPTYCSGRTQPPQPVGERLTQAQCDAVDQQTAIEYGCAVYSG
ncbi:hypothetical protein [Variovorax sp. GB1P17]|uniref:hypothetical protein n=1 Tax=Variovorax sp. GB1P17 TaxID=3443740 RepID=UPI003F484546